MRPASPEPTAVAPSPHPSPDPPPRRVRVLPGRLPAAEMFPAGRRDLTARFVTLASGLRVRVVESGPEVGPTVLLVHGWACSIYSFRYNIAPLAEAGFHVVAADLKGSGLSDKPIAPGEYGSEALSVHLLEILDALGVERATLVGHSMGGALVLDVAMRAPERVERVALLASIGLGEATAIRALRVLTPRALAPLYPRLVRRWLVPIVLRVAYGVRGTFTPRDVDEYWAPTQFPEAVYAALAEAHEFVWSPVPAERLRMLRGPTLVVLGSRDRLVRLRATQRLAEALPDARLHVVEGAGHVVMEEAPDEVNQALLEFLAGERA